MKVPTITVVIYIPRLLILSIISSIATNSPAIKLQIPIGENLSMKNKKK